MVQKIDVYAMSDERYQPIGVAIYRDDAEIRAEIAQHHCLDGVDLDAAVDEFIDACQRVTIKVYPDGGYFASFDEFENAIC